MGLRCDGTRQIAEDLMLPMEIDGGESPGAADGRTTKPRKKNRSPSPTTIRHDFAGGVLAEAETTGAWTGAKKAKVQEGAPASEDLDIADAADEMNPEPEQAAAGQEVEGAFDWSQVEGFDWTEADVKEELDSYRRCFGLPDLDDEFWNLNDDQQTEEIRKRLAICHIRAHKGAGLNDAQLLSVLEKDGSFLHYESPPRWTFDVRRFRISVFQDYQRIIPLKDPGYLNWQLYYDAFSTLESDQQFVCLWEKLLDKTKWLQHYHKFTPQEGHGTCDALSGSEDESRLPPNLFEEFLYSVTNDHFYARVYFEIWKRVAQQKMNSEDALDEVKDIAMWPFQSRRVQGELKTDNYKTCVDGIDKSLEESEAYWLIFEAVRKLVLRLKTYYEYAKNKLDIANKMGLIRSGRPTSST